MRIDHSNTVSVDAIDYDTVMYVRTRAGFNQNSKV